jgi:hypothetical protein
MGKSRLRPVPPKPVAPMVDTALFSELRDLISGLAERVGDPRAESRALVRSLATQAEKLGELAALQNDTARPSRQSSVVSDHELYAARRFALLCDKWKPSRIVAFGPAAAHHLGLWRWSPHVSPQVRELIQAAETE